MQFKLYPQDKANHYAYGSVVAAISACTVMWTIVFGAALLRLPRPTFLFLLGAGVAISAAYWAGRYKEGADAIDNAEAANRGEPAVHSVETGDWQFTTWGAAPVALTLCILQILAVVR